MLLRDRLTRLAVRPHLPRRTVRLRLTALYSCLFLVLGAGLVITTYVLVRRATEGVYVYRAGDGVSGAFIKATKPPNDGPARPRTTESLRVGGAPGDAQLTPQQLEAQARRLETLAKQQHNDQLRQLLIQSGIALAIMSVASIALGWFIAGRILRPIRTITTSTRAISATNLHHRLALGGPDDELKELGDTIDELLGRLEGSFDAQRAFVANASHELRTPLARQQAVVQVALADPGASVDSLRAAHERVLAAGEQQERLIEALLTLTRGQAGLVKREPFDLAAVTDGVVQARRTEAELREVAIDAALAPAPAAGNPHLVERLVANLVDNALRHNTAHGRVTIVAGRRNGHAILSVTNDGPIVPPAELDRIFLPLQRLDTARTSHAEGLGLGLSIVQAIADAHDATVSTRARPHGGLDIEISFPVSPDAGVAAVAGIAEDDRYSRGSTGSLSSASTPNTHSWTR